MGAPDSLWNNRSFARLWTARLVSRFGSALSYVVLIWLTFTETGSALAVAYIGLAEFVPVVALGVFSGAIVDRFDRRRVTVLSVLGRSAAMAGLIVALEALGFRLAFVLAAAVVFALRSTFFAPGSQALLPEIVPREALADANGLFESTESIVGIGASALAGVSVGVIGTIPSLGVDVGAYLVAAIFVALVGTSVIARPPAPLAPAFLAEVRAGFRFLRESVGLLELTIAGLLLNFFFAFVLTFLVVYSGTSSGAVRPSTARSRPSSREGSRSAPCSSVGLASLDSPAGCGPIPRSRKGSASARSCSCRSSGSRYRSSSDWAS
ncbi:MAG: MFS transporter [Thermoplasmata archaeon]